VPIGHVLGIPVTVHASFALLVALVLAGASAEEAPAPPTQLAWLALLFGCVVLHELAHALVARSRGVVVEEIELLPFGGLTRLGTEPRSAGDDLAISIAGPGANLALAGGFAVVATAYGVGLWPPTLYAGALLNRLVWLNLVLGLGNLLPIIPLDGGSVFRDVLTRSLGRERAQLVTIRLARAGAFALIIAGLFAQVWLAVLGAVVLVVANGQENAFWIEHSLRGLLVADLPIHTGHAIPPGLPVVDAGTPLLDCPLRHGARCAVVRRDGAIVGTVFGADLEALVQERLPRRRAR
jgi:Zn-dependent protease